jgi:Zn-dependent peptidase ImmA (M78 family)
MNGDDPGQLARAAARRELISLKIEALDEINIEDIAARRDLFVVDGGLDGAEGRSVIEDGAAVIRIRRDITQPARRRFVIAHELGHCVLHATGKFSSCSERDLMTYDEGNPEAEANWFAAEILMPGNLVRPLCNVPPSFEAIERVARRCNTTLTATAIRFVQLSPEGCALVWSEDGRVKWSVRSPDFPGWVARGRVLNGLTHAGDVFRGKEVPANAQPVPQHAWLDRRVEGGRDLMEETRSFSRLKAALTLLWLPVGRDEDEHDDDDDDPRWRR